MAMNGNEGCSAYPPNPDVKSGSCLIAGFHALTDIRPSYWNAYKAESGATFSIDMVRLRLSFINMLGRGSRPKVREFLRAPMVELSPDRAAAAVAEARSWCARFE